MKPENLRYTKSHEWVGLDSEGEEVVATVGISDFALEALTDLVFIELPESGGSVQAGEPFGQIESVKAVSDLYSPISGEIVEVNTAVVDDLDTLMDDPYGRGWLIKVKVADTTEIEQLLDHAAYRKQCEEEAEH